MRKPYDRQGYEVKISYTATVYKDGEAVYTTRACRLQSQAEVLADEWIRNQLGITYPDSISLEVQNMSVGSDTIFGGN